jgi:hypothetical protein
MPTEALIPVAAETRHPVASRRILRLALGTALSLWFSQAAAWPLSFVCPILTMFILALPIPAPSLKTGIVFVVALVLPMLGGMALLPFLIHFRWAGTGLLTLALFYSFYFTARGGSPVLGTFMTIGLTVVVTIGSVSMDLMLPLIESLFIGAISGMTFVWLAHAVLPELPPDPAVANLQRPAPAKPTLRQARLAALRSLLVVLPLTLIFLFMSGSPSYTVVMIKVATMGQQASIGDSRALGRSLLESTFWGGVGAILAWYVMLIWPSLLLYTLLIALAALLFGRGIFTGQGVHPKRSMWTYAFLTMIVIIAPALLDGPGSSGANSAFWTRLWLLVLVAIYGNFAVVVFDAFFPPRNLLKMADSR